MCNNERDSLVFVAEEKLNIIVHSNDYLAAKIYFYAIVLVDHMKIFVNYVFVKV